ncbi:hypothetical protein K435DRAFT_871185 [Dendrothele bispora CBS 962.96]|uniref:Uncharacterized protein n=1 Tax=Dendrothele bispora (strain CBS 962.96) TaxID=1314807 RepID=A0A4S8L5B7_DENBC|nr:hypothetical protein K435DRAFT_871185 [Dendrothele bispora CBS 962.96]
MASTVSEYFDDAIIRITNDNGSFLLFVSRDNSLPVELVELSPLEALGLHSNPSPQPPSSCHLCSDNSHPRSCPRARSLLETNSDSDSDSGSFSSLPDLVTPMSSSASDSDSMIRISRLATPLPGYEHPPSYSSNMPLFPSFIKLSPITYPLSSSELAYVESSVYDLDQQDLYYKAWANSLWKPHSPFHTPYHRIRLSFLKHATDRFRFHRAEDLYYLSISMGRNRMDTVLAFQHESRLWIDPIPMIDSTRFHFYWNLTWSEVAEFHLTGSIPARYGEEGDGPFSRERFRIWMKPFIVREVGDLQFEVLHRQGIKKRGRGLPVMQIRGKLEDDFIDYWWKNRNIWKFSRAAFGVYARDLIPSVTQYWVLDLECRLDWLFEKCFPFWCANPLLPPRSHVFRYNMFSPTNITFDPLFRLAPPPRVELIIPDVDHDYTSFNNPFNTPLVRSD